MHLQGLAQCIELPQLVSKRFTGSGRLTIPQQDIKFLHSPEQQAYPWRRHAGRWHSWSLWWHARPEASRGHESRRCPLTWRPLGKLWGWHARSWGSPSLARGWDLTRGSHDGCCLYLGPRKHHARCWTSHTSSWTSQTL